MTIRIREMQQEDVEYVADTSEQSLPVVFPERFESNEAADSDVDG